MGKLSEWNKLSKWGQEEIENLNSPITIKGIKFLIKNLPTKKLHSLLFKINKQINKAEKDLEKFSIHS